MNGQYEKLQGAYQDLRHICVAYLDDKSYLEDLECQSRFVLELQIEYDKLKEENYARR